MSEHYRTPLIIMYHSVRDSFAGGPFGIEITPKNFESHIDFLTSHFRVVTLLDFINALNSGVRTEGMAAITFDDAFEDNLSAAAPILRKYSAPATVFAPTGFIGRPYFWWDALPRLWSAAPERLAEAEQAIRTRFPDLAPHAASASAQFQTAIWDRLRRLPTDLAYQFTEEFAARLGASLENLPRPATESELPQFDRWPFEVGSHGVSHRVLPSLTMDDMLEEARASRRYLQDRIGRAPATFCYPFGLADRDVRHAVRDAGYAGAVNVTSSDTPLLHYGDLFDLPRIDASYEDASELAGRLRKLDATNARAFIAARSERFTSVAANAQQQSKGASLRERNSDRPDVSIIIPVFNAAPYLEGCLDTVLGQSLETIEVICIDDASTDGSAKILQEAANRDPRVRVLSNQNNLGPGPSRNRGIDAARGRFLRVVDADDLLPRDSTEALLSRAVATGADLVRGALICFTHPDPGQIEFVVETPDRLSTTFANDRDLWAPYWHSSYLIAFDLLQDDSIRYPGLICGEDPVFLAKVLTKSGRVSLISDVVYLYRRYPKSTGSFGRSFNHLVDFLRHASLVKTAFLERHPPAWIEGYGPFLLTEIRTEMRGLLNRSTPDAAQISFAILQVQEIWGIGAGFDDIDEIISRSAADALLHAEASAPKAAEALNVGSAAGKLSAETPAQPIVDTAIDNTAPASPTEDDPNLQGAAEATEDNSGAVEDSGPVETAQPPVGASPTDGSFDETPETFAALLFPLNVYAELLRRETGQVLWLHFPLFEHPDELFPEAQRHSTDLILAQLPPPPARILEVGTGFGTLLAELVERGYDVTGLNPDPVQVTIARRRFGADLPVVEAPYQAFDSSTGAPDFDVILFQESAQYIDLLQIFDRALALLKPGGSIIILDEFAIRRTPETPQQLHLYDEMVALAERRHFTVKAEKDLTARAAPAVDAMLTAAERYRAALESELGVPGAMLDALQAANQINRAAYAEGRLGYRLLVLRRRVDEKAAPFAEVESEHHPDPAEPLALAALSFPLNIHAELLRRETEQARPLHFGLFEHPDEPFSDAQQHATDLILAHLPPPPARVLEVGTGLLSLSEELAGRGYEVTEIHAAPGQAAARQSHFSAMSPILEAPYEAITLDAGAPGFDAILFPESAQYIGSLLLFDRALDLLNSGGSIVILDEFALRRTSWSPEPLHLHENVVALAERLGFSVEVDRDVSEQAPARVSAVLKMAERDRAALDDELGLPGSALDAFEASKRDTQAAIAEGRVGYRLLVLRRNVDKGWRLRELKSEHVPEFAELFKETFGHDMSPSLWTWKYSEGRGLSLGLWVDGRLATHYGSLSRPALAFGHPTRLALPGDVMARKGSQQNIGRRGPFFACAATMQEIDAGLGTAHLVGAGFPNARHFRGARLLGLYSESADRVVELRWPLAPDDGAPLLSRRLSDPDDAEARRAVDNLWTRMAADLCSCVVAVRDWPSLVQRYLRHPDLTYEIHIVSDGAGDGDLGVVVLRRTAENSVELLDLVGPLDAFAAVVAASRRIAATAGAKDLWGWFAERCVADHLAGPDCAVLDIEVETSTFIWRPGIPLEDLRGRVWLTGGDTDFH